MRTRSPKPKASWVAGRFCKGLLCVGLELWVWGIEGLAQFGQWALGILRYGGLVYLEI